MASQTRYINYKKFGGLLNLGQNQQQNLFCPNMGKCPNF